VAILRLMTTFKMRWILALAIYSTISHSSTPKSWDDLILEHHYSFKSSGFFVSFDDDYHYLGFSYHQQNMLDAEFEFLSSFQDRISDLMSDLCEESQTILSDKYQFNFSFNKNVVEQPQKILFITSVNKKVLSQEAIHACIK
jgi:hypothetical protein